MDINYMFYKDLPLVDEKIFLANLAENNEIEEISVKKTQPTLDARSKS